MSKKRKALTQEEIWDDSELIDSWNEALDEYKHYHSLHARGEKVQQVLRQEEEADSKSSNAASITKNNEPDADADSMAESEGEIIESKINATHDLEEHKLNGPAPLHAKHVAAAGPGVPQALMSGVKDEALKNLMMSWYYAGYYTGFYEGQQAQMQEQHKQQREPVQTGDTDS